MADQQAQTQSVPAGALVMAKVPHSRSAQVVPEQLRQRFKQSGLAEVLAKAKAAEHKHNSSQEHTPGAEQQNDGQPAEKRARTTTATHAATSDETAEQATLNPELLHCPDVPVGFEDELFIHDLPTSIQLNLVKLAISHHPQRLKQVRDTVLVSVLVCLCLCVCLCLSAWFFVCVCVLFFCCCCCCCFSCLFLSACTEVNTSMACLPVPCSYSL